MVPKKNPNYLFFIKVHQLLERREIKHRPQVRRMFGVYWFTDTFHWPWSRGLRLSHWSLVFVTKLTNSTGLSRYLQRVPVKRIIGFRYEPDLRFMYEHGLSCRTNVSIKSWLGVKYSNQVRSIIDFIYCLLRCVLKTPQTVFGFCEKVYFKQCIQILFYFTQLYTLLIRGLFVMRGAFIYRRTLVHIYIRQEFTI